MPAGQLDDVPSWCPGIFPGEISERTGVPPISQDVGTAFYVLDLADSFGIADAGDLGGMDASGYCRIHGRLKDMIIRGGDDFDFYRIRPIMD